MRSLKSSVVVSIIIACSFANTTNFAALLVDGNTAGYYNSSLGTTLDGTQPQFPIPYFSGGGDPLINPAGEPNLSAAASVLGGWLNPVPTRNQYWGALGPIPATWADNTETAIIYEVNGGPTGFTNVMAQLDADNGVFVWVNGQYKFGAIGPGSPSPAGQFEYTNVFLGTLSPGTNYIQVLREDNGIMNGYQIRITGNVIIQPPGTSSFGPVQFIPGVGFQMRLNLQSGRNYRVQFVTVPASTNWTTFTNITNSGATAQVLDPTISTTRWYRIVSP